MLKTIDLFAGIGGIRLGYEQAFGEELKTVFVSEWDEHAQKTYKANFADDFEIAGDITKISEIFVLRVFLVKHSALQDNAKALRTITKVCRAVHYSLTLLVFAIRKNRR